MKAVGYAEKGNLEVLWGDDAPALWLDALHVYQTARDATRAHFREMDMKKKPKG